MKRLRLVKLVVQPTFVIDNGETLEEAPGQAVVVNPADLDNFPAKLRADMAVAEEALNAQPDPALNGAEAPA
jgi:hypothetical protein